MSDAMGEMKTSIAIGGADSGKNGRFDDIVEFAVEAEKLGVDGAWSAEAWGMDSIAPLAFLAARTERMTLGTSISQISARTPTMTAMTAMSMAMISGNRFILGLGVSGPQVVEGLHGIPFDHPLGRLRETIEILRLAFAGEMIEFKGRHFELPRPGGEGKALRLALPPNPEIPIYVASIGPKALELTGELADGWAGTSFTPETARVYLDAIERGATRSGRTLSDIAIKVTVPVGFGDDVERLIKTRKPALAFMLGGMGSPRTNFYNRGYRSIGYEEAAAEVLRLWNEGRRDAAIEAVPDELALATSLLGTESMVRQRIRAYRAAGVTNLHLQPMGGNTTRRLDTLGRAVELVREENGGDS
jgi:F420-dependent oxidoreductase-like protein